MVIRVPRPAWNEDDATDEQRRILRRGYQAARKRDQGEAEVWAALQDGIRAGIPLDEFAARLQTSRPTFYRRKDRLKAWWDGLDQADRDLFLSHRDDPQLPAEVVKRLVETDQLVVGAKWEADPGYTFYWPADIHKLLQRESGDDE